MSQSPSQFDVSSLNDAQQCDCWRHHSSSFVCVRSVACLGFCRFHQCKKPGSRSIWSCILLPVCLKMTTAQVVKTSVTVNNNSPIQDYIHPDDQTQPFAYIIQLVFLPLKKQQGDRSQNVSHYCSQDCYWVCSAYSQRPNFSLSLVTGPEDFAKVNSVHVLLCFKGSKFVMHSSKLFPVLPKAL